MAETNTNKSIFGKVGKSYSLDQLSQMFVRGMDVYSAGSRLGGPGNVYRQATWFNICVSRLAKDCGRVPIRISRKAAEGTRAVWGRKHVRAGSQALRKTCREKSSFKAADGQIIEAGELYEFLRRPNQDQRWNAFIQAHKTQLQIHGRIHWLFDDMAGRKPLSMYVVPGSKSRPIVDDSGKVKKLLGWKIAEPRGGEYTALLEECITFQIFNPDDPYAGLSPREPANLAIISDYNASVFNAAMFANNCEPGTILKSTAPYNPTLDEQIRTSWQQRHSGPMNARKLAILWGGLEHETIGQNISSSYADYTFTIDGSGLVSGDKLSVLVQASVQETGGASSLTAQVGSVRMKIDIRG